MMDLALGEPPHTADAPAGDIAAIGQPRHLLGVHVQVVRQRFDGEVFVSHEECGDR